MYDNLFKALALLIILYAVYHLIRLIRNIIQESKIIDRKKGRGNRGNGTSSPHNRHSGTTQ